MNPRVAELYISETKRVCSSNMLRGNVFSLKHPSKSSLPHYFSQDAPSPRGKGCHILRPLCQVSLHGPTDKKAVRRHKHRQLM